MYEVFATENARFPTALGTFHDLPILEVSATFYCLPKTPTDEKFAFYDG
jgi:hypothetical protein